MSNPNTRTPADVEKAFLLGMIFRQRIDIHEPIIYVHIPTENAFKAIEPLMWGYGYLCESDTKIYIDCSHECKFVKNEFLSMINTTQFNAVPDNEVKVIVKHLDELKQACSTNEGIVYSKIKPEISNLLSKYKDEIQNPA